MSNRGKFHCLQIVYIFRRHFSQFRTRNEGGREIFRAESSAKLREGAVGREPPPPLLGAFSGRLLGAPSRAKKTLLACASCRREVTFGNIRFGIAIKMQQGKADIAQTHSRARSVLTALALCDTQKGCVRFPADGGITCSDLRGIRGGAYGTRPYGALWLRAGKRNDLMAKRVAKWLFFRRDG